MVPLSQVLADLGIAADALARASRASMTRSCFFASSNTCSSHAHVSLATSLPSCAPKARLRMHAGCVCESKMTQSDLVERGLWSHRADWRVGHGRVERATLQKSPFDET
eukprot:2817167-Rhodomonas_salina.1